MSSWTPCEPEVQRGVPADPFGDGAGFWIPLDGDENAALSETRIGRDPCMSDVPDDLDRASFDAAEGVPT